MGIHTYPASHETRSAGTGIARSVLMLVAIAAILEFGIMTILLELAPIEIPWWAQALVDANVLGIGLSLSAYVFLLHPIRKRLLAIVSHEPRSSGIGIARPVLMLLVIAVTLEFVIMMLLRALDPIGMSWWAESLVDAGSLGLSLSGAAYVLLVHPIRKRLLALHDTLANMVTETAHLTGDAFYEAMVELLGKWIGASFVMVGEIIDDGDSVKVINAWSADDIPSIDQYKIAGTPCEKVLHGNLSVISRGVTKSYPDDTDLKNLHAVGYMGVPMFDEARNVIGLISVITTKPLSNWEPLLLMTRVLAARAGAELVHRRHEEASATANRRKAMIESIVEQAMIISVTDADSVITYVNEQFCRLSGYSSKELLGQNHRISKSGKHSADVWKKMYDTASNGGVWVGNILSRAKDGSLYEAYSAITANRDDVGKVMEYIAIRFDITALRKSEGRARTLMEAMGAVNEGILFADCKGRVEYANPAMCGMLGYDRQHCAIPNIRQVITEPTIREEIAKAIDTGEGVTMRVPIVSLDREDKPTGWGELELTPLREGEASELRGFIVTCWDITSQIDRERMLEFKNVLNSLQRLYQPILGQKDILIDYRLEEILEYICHAQELGFSGRGSIYIQEADGLRLAASIEEEQTDDNEADEVLDCVIPLAHLGEMLGEMTISLQADTMEEEVIESFLHQLGEQISLAVASDRLARRALEIEHEQAEQIYAMGKEMRTPMTSIVGAAEMLEEAGIDESDRKELTFMVRRNADYLIAAVDNMLDLSGATVAGMCIMPDSPGEERMPLEDIRVLVIESIGDGQDMIVAALRDAKAVVEVSRSSHQAIHLALSAWRAQRSHAAVVLDVELGETEVDLVPRLLREAGYKAPIVMIAHDDQASAQEDRFMAAGCDRFLRGPIDGQDLVREVKQAIEQSSLKSGERAA